MNARLTARADAAVDEDVARQRALDALSILDTPPEDSFDRVARLAAEIFRTPIALVSFIDADRQWLKAAHGLNIRQTERQHAFCAHTIKRDGVFIVEDAAADPLFRDNPLVVASPNIRFYAGAAIADESGIKLGALCVLDRAPRPFSEDERRRLAALAACVESELKLRSARNREARARALAEDALEARRRLVSNLSHEMRTPLNSIRGYERLLRDTDLTPEQRTYLDQLAASGRMLLGNVTRYIESADMRGAGLVVAERSCDVAHIIEEAVETVEGILEDKGMTIVIDMPPTGLEAVTDPDIVRSALSCVLAGIVALERARDIKLTVRADAARGQLDLTTSFSTLHAIEPGARKARRLANGLRNARRVIAALDGRLRISHTHAGAASVILQIPCRIEERRRPANAKKLRVLVADDMFANLKLLEAYLLRMGHEPILARDGEEAVEITSRQQVDIVLMDLQMPRLDGFEATRRILAATRCDEAPTIIAVSANATSEDRQACARAGFFDFLPKPVSLNAIAACLERAVSRRTSRTPEYIDHRRASRQAA